MVKNYKNLFPSNKVLLLIMISLFIGGIWIGFNWLSSLLLTIIFFTSFCGLVAYLDEKGHLEGERFFPTVPMIIILFSSFYLVGGFVLNNQPSEENIDIDLTVER